MDIGVNRAVRTWDSEQFIIFSSDPDAGSPLHEEATHATRVGHLIVQYAQSTLSKPFVTGTLLLEADWDEDAYSALIRKLDYELVSSIGGGGRHQRESFDVEVFIGESVGGATDRIESDEERGLHGIHNQLRQTQEMVESIPESIDEVIAEQYGEIEDIIESQDLDEEEKRRRVQDKLRVGIEMGLPTIMYEGSAEDR